MSMEPTKEEFERIAFELLLQALPELGGGTFDPGKPPEPDVIYQKGDECIGVEVTRVHIAEALKQREGEFDSILALAQRIYEKRGNPPVSVSVSWTASFHPRRADRQDIARQLAAIAETHIPPRSTFAVLGFDDVREWPIGKEGVVRFRLERIVDYEPGQYLWFCSDGWFQPAAGPELIRDAFDRKNCKPQRYRTPYAATWLLVVQRGSGRSSGFSFQDATFEEIYESSFDRAFFVNALARQARELRVRSIGA